MRLNLFLFAMKSYKIYTRKVRGVNMENREKWFETMQELRDDNIKKQKKGLHFIITSVLIWLAICLIHASDMPIMTKNFATFCCSVPLMPIAFLISKIIKVDFQNKGNPLTTLGIITSVNQMLYLLIVMWAYATVPEKMVMVYAMVFGAHLLPFGWLYQSKAYYVLSVVIPIAALMIGIQYSAVAVAAFVLVAEVILSICLVMELKRSSCRK